MVVSRRGFIKQGSLLVLGTGVSLGSADRIFGRAHQDNKPAPLTLIKATFEPHLNTVFRIFRDSSTSISATLVTIEDIGPVPDKAVAGRECFLLTFRGTEKLPQHTYRLDHAVLGTFELFLVPGGSNKKGIYYEAVINRLNG
jgi:hypothetical protein